MKKWALLFMLFCYAELEAQQSKVNGIVTLFNSQTKTGKRVFINGARVDDKFKKAQTSFTDTNGQFDLEFVEEKTGKTVYLKVMKDKLEAINKDNLSAVTGQLDMIKISMAPPDSIEQYVLEIFNIGKTKAEKNLEIKAAKLETQLKDMKNNLSKNADRIKVLEQEKATLEEQRKKVYDQAQQLAVKYGAVDLDDASPVFREAFLLFQEGNLDSAQTLLSNINLQNTVTQILRERDSIAAGRIALERRDSIEKQRTQDAGQVLQFKADLHRTFYQLDSAAACYELLVRLDSVNTVFLVAYAGFLEWTNQNETAIFYYQKALAIQQNKGRIDDPLIARIDNNLGNLYMAKRAYDSAGTALQESFSIRKNLADSDAVYKSDLAKTMNNLGSFYYAEKKLDSAIILYNAALVIRELINGKDSVLNKAETASIKNNLGIIYYSQKNYQLAETNFLEALSIRASLPQKDSITNEPETASALNNLATVYFMNKDYEKAKNFYDQSAKIRMKLAERSLQTYAPGLAQTFNSLASLYASGGNKVEAEKYYLQSLVLRTSLAGLDPETYEPSVAQTTVNLALLYKSAGHMVEAKDAYTTALAIYKKLAANNSQLYMPFVEKVQAALAEIK